MDQQPQDTHDDTGSSLRQVKLIVVVQIRYKKYVNAYFLLCFILHYYFGLILNIVLIILFSQMSVDHEKGKEKVVHEEPHDEQDQFIIGFALGTDPMTVLQKVLHALSRALMQLASISPQTPQIQ